MREYIVCICFAVIFCAGVGILVPGKKYEGIIKIVCGIFVVSTVLGPIKNILSHSGDALNFDRYFTDDGSFDYYVSYGRDEFNKALLSPENEITEAVLVAEIRTLAGGDVTVNLQGGNAYITGVDGKDEDSVMKYLKDTYSINAIFVN